MADFVTLDSIGDGNCLLNSYAINMAFHFLSGNQEKWLRIFDDPIYKKHYVKLANALIQQLNLNYAPLDETADSRALHMQFDFIFRSIRLPEAESNLDIDWVRLQEVLSPILREHMVAYAQDPDAQTRDIHDRVIPIQPQLQELFDQALEANVLSFNVNQSAEGIFQGQPIFTGKLQELFANANLGNDEASHSQEYRQRHLHLIEAFKKWFYQEDKEGGKYQYFFNEKQGIAKNYTQLDPFAFDLLTGMYGTTVQYRRENNANAKQENGIRVINGNSWAYHHRFYKPPASHSDYPVNDADLVFHCETLGAHWTACLAHNQQTLRLAEMYALQKANYIDKKSSNWENAFVTPNEKQKNKEQVTPSSKPNASHSDARAASNYSSLDKVLLGLFVVAIFIGVSMYIPCAATTMPGVAMGYFALWTVLTVAFAAPLFGLYDTIKDWWNKNSAESSNNSEASKNKTSANQENVYANKSANGFYPHYESSKGNNTHSFVAGNQSSPEQQGQKADTMPKLG